MNDITYHGWSSFTRFFSASSTQNYLKHKYERIALDHADQKSYENCYPFLYYLEHGQIYYQQAEKAPLLIRPILLFYGLIHLIKACILTIDPNYPETTSVLAHGVSARKRKKQNYHFFDDEVKFQKSGLFSFMSEKMFHMKQTEGEKASMGDLLNNIPELEELFLAIDGKPAFMEIKKEQQSFFFPKKILDHFHMTESRFIQYYQSKSAIPITAGNCSEHAIELIFSDHDREPSPLKFHYEKGALFLPLSKSAVCYFPELLIHYLLLYNLSMIARYETEWWSELIKMMPNKDFPFIHSFLNITMKKSPFLAHRFLVNNHLRPVEKRQF
ncbi:MULTISPECIES: YaaC family protein [Bacillus]|uniref:YaaC family protein n=1 Tax=Bacillus TaxID=1386 RepID=UPI001FE7DAC8|nr:MULTISPECIES: YaaC family protein [Bacillus]